MEDSSGASLAAKGTAAALYETKSTVRNHYLQRAQACSKLTIPALFPPDGMSPSAELYKPWQSLGARAVNTLSAKLLMALMGTTFFRLRPDSAVQEEVDRLDPADKKALESALAKTEKRVKQRTEDDADSVVVFELLKHLLVGGNGLVYLGTKGSRLYHLSKYIVCRDADGEAKDIVVKEVFSKDDLPENVLALLTMDNNVPGDSDEKTIPVYTRIVRKKQQWFEYQEVNGQRVPDSEGQYPLDACPWLALRLVRIDGEDYGRSFVDEYYGDLRSLESLSKSIVTFSAAAAFILYLVKPNGTTDPRTISRANTGDVREGDADDVTVLTLEKYSDFQAARSTIEDISQRLSMSFLLTTSIQRDAERVTAEEIREMAKDLDAGLGGVYTLLSKEFQLPYVRRKMKVMEREKSIPRLPHKDIRIVIVTGMEAIGRGHDKTKLMGWVSTLAQTFGPEWLLQRLDSTVFAERLGTADGIDIDGLLLPEANTGDGQEDLMNKMIEKVGPEAGKQMVKSMGEQPQAAPQ